MDKPLIVIVGPTCVGKTEASIYIAEKLNGEIISADSRTFYRGMDIGTAKPSKDELKRVRHHLIDVADPDNTWNLAIFQQKAEAAIRDIHSRNHIPFLVGGTGQYIRSVAFNWSPPPISPDPRLRIALEKLGLERGKETLYRALLLLDPEAAKLIDFRNVRRTIRALEVILFTGVKFSIQRKKNLSPYKLIMIGLERPRVDLYERIDKRIEKMVSDGLIEEVKKLLGSGYSPDLPSMSAIGYRECAQVVAGNITIDQAIIEIKKKTRIFVRRQANWFKLSDSTIQWFNISEQSFPAIEEYIHQFLKIF
jgi:tRNA dimethylallyltransferase